MRTTQTRKRSRPNTWAYKSKYKKRRFVRRKRKTSYVATSKRSTIPFGFRNTKFNRRRYKRNLWNATDVLMHYRSSNSVDTNLSNADNVLTKTITGFNPLFVQYAFHDYHLVTDSNGGTFASTLAWGSKFVIRGGRVTLHLINNGSHVQHIRIHRLWTSARPDIASLPASAGLSSAPEEYYGDFKNKMGKIYETREFNIEPQAASTYEWKIPVFACEKEDVNGGQRQPYFIIESNNMFTTDTESIKLIGVVNLSFTGDVITP